MPGVGLTCTDKGKAPTERPALEPYWGKLAVRNLRGDDGNVGIIRSPVRAIVLPDPIPRAISCMAPLASQTPSARNSPLSQLWHCLFLWADAYEWPALADFPELPRRSPHEA
jgi:hypothetical protein